MPLFPEARRSVLRTAFAIVPGAALVVAFGATGATLAAEAHAVESWTVQALVTGIDPAGSGDGVSYRATVQMRGQAMRVEFERPGAEPGYLLHPGDDEGAWLVSEAAGFAMPVRAEGFRSLRVDGAEPCASLRLRCEVAAARRIAGRTATGWRYRNARGRGPGGTDEGEFWVDAQSGLVLAYRGRAGSRGRLRQFEALSVSPEPLPAGLFVLAETLRPPPAGANRATDRGSSPR